MSAFIPILRSSFLYLSKQATLRKWIETSDSAARFTSRFIAGLHLEDALRVAVRLAREKTLVTLDHLGENVTAIDEARRSRDDYLEALSRLAELQLGATISVKLTALGLDLSERECTNNLSSLVERAAALGTRVEVDMEDSSYTDRTFSQVFEMNRRFPGSVRAVVQAYLYRTGEDVDHLSAEHIPVRLCKGAYNEPPGVAFPRKKDVDANYTKLLDALLDRGALPAIATHDPKLVNYALEGIRARQLTPDKFEFEMLYGVRRDLQSRVLAQGYTLRLYVPYGSAWYPYFMRRLAERPANVGFIVRNILHG